VTLRLKDITAAVLSIDDVYILKGIVV